MIIAQLVLMAATNCAVYGHAESALYINSGPESDLSTDESHIKAWMERQTVIQRKFAKAARDAKGLTMDEVPGELRDAVGDKGRSGAAALSKRIAQANVQERRALLDHLPGMTAAPFESCRSIESCPDAPLLLHVNDISSLNDTVAAIMKPWILVQKAKQKAFGVVASGSSGDQILRLRLDGLPDAGLEIHVSAVAVGGINVWLRGRKDPAALYESQRHSILAAIASAQ